MPKSFHSFPMRTHVKLEDLKVINVRDEQYIDQCYIDRIYGNFGEHALSVAVAVNSVKVFDSCFVIVRFS